jgi:hypothetical protein
MEYWILLSNKMDEEDMAQVLSNLANHNVAYTTRNICLKISTKEMNDLLWLRDIDQNQVIVLE